MVAVDPQDVEAGEEDNKEDHHDEQSYERVRIKGALVKVATC